MTKLNITPARRQHDPELRHFYLRKRAQGHEHKVALSHLMRILTRRLVAVLRSGLPYQSYSQPNLANAAYHLDTSHSLSPSHG